MRLTHNQEYYGLLCVTCVMRVLPRRIALLVGAAVGQLGWALRIRRRIVVDNIAQAMPGLSRRECRRLAARSSRNFGRTAAEFVRFDGGDRRRVNELVSIEGVEELSGVLQEGRGALVLTGHLGAWALYVTALAEAGIATSLLVGRQSNARVDEFIHSIPGDAVGFIPKGRSAVRQILRCLKAGTSVVMVADQHPGAPSRGTLAPFLGRETSTLALPGAFVARYDVPLFLMVGHRVAGGRHQVVLRRIEVERCGCEEDQRRHVATAYNHSLGEAVLEHPDQYFWYHRRWRDSDRELLSTSA